MVKKNKYNKRTSVVSRSMSKLIQSPQINIDKQNDFYIVSPLQAKHAISKCKIDLSMRFRVDDTNKINLAKRQLNDFYKTGGKILVARRVFEGGVWPPFIADEIKNYIIIKDSSKLKK